MTSSHILLKMESRYDRHDPNDAYEQQDNQDDTGNLQQEAKPPFPSHRFLSLIALPVEKGGANT